MPHNAPDWDTCTATEPTGATCIGILLHPYQLCLRHLAPEELTNVLGQWNPEQDVDLRGTELSDNVLSKILNAVTDPGSGRPRLGTARFEQARFSGAARFDRAKFTGAARFDRAQFNGDAWFDRAQFSGNAGFNRVQFNGDAWFDRAQFSVDARFDRAQFNGETRFGDTQFSRFAGFGGAQFSGDARFDRAQFSGKAGFDRAQFSGKAGFDRAQFSGDAEFSGAQFSGKAGFGDTQFSGDAGFGGAQFSGDAGFDRAQFSGDAQFGGAQFRSARFLGPLAVRATFDLADAVFERSVQIQAAAPVVAFRGTRFEADADLRLRYADVILDGATCATLMTVAAVAGRQEDQPVPEDMVTGAGTATATPRLVSLRAVDASRLVLTDIDLSECPFAEARHLDNIRIAGHSPFAQTPHPGRWGWTVGRAWPGVWRWSTRRVLAEEHTWRATTSKKHGWTPPTTQAATAPLGPARLAVLYRELRKAQEDRGNEPGAADFYYGEMEMRRHSPATPLSERFVLAAYWAISGYGLRATRAFLVLAAVIAVSALLLQHHGFTAPIHPSYLDTLLYSAHATLSLDVKGANFPDTLTRWGQVLRIILRIAGPLFLGLAALALRGRVKR